MKIVINMYRFLLICLSINAFAGDPEMPKKGVVLLQITEKREEFSMDRGWKARVVGLKAEKLAEECYLVPEVGTVIDIFNIVNCVDFKIGDFVYSKSFFTSARSACAQAIKNGESLVYHGAFKAIKDESVINTGK